MYFLVKMRGPPPAPPPRPELQELFENIAQSPTLNPIMRSMVLAFLYGANLPEYHRNAEEQWFEMKERENNYDPDFYGIRV